MLVNGADVLADSEIVQHFTTSYPGIKLEDAEKLSSLIKDGVAVMIDTRLPVILTLDKVGQIFTLLIALLCDIELLTMRLPLFLTGCSCLMLGGYAIPLWTDGVSYALSLCCPVLLEGIFTAAHPCL